MKTPNKVPDGCIALDGNEPLFADGESIPEVATFEREIALTGEYKSRKFTLARQQFEQIIANHKASGVDPAVDRGHETWLGADPGTEARGWVRELSIRPSTMRPGRDALVAKIELNDLGRHAVANKHFRYLSIGVELNGKDKQTAEPVGAVLDHLALVKRPQIEGMQPLSLSAIEPAPEETSMKALFTALGVKDDASEAEALTAFSSKLTAKDAEITALKAQNTASDARLLALEADAKAQRLARLEQKLDAKIAAFAVDPSEKAAQMELASSAPEQFEKLLALRTPRDPSGPKLVLAKGPADSVALQDKAIAEYMKANAGADYATALVACALSAPELFNDEVI